MQTTVTRVLEAVDMVKDKFDAMWFLVFCQSWMVGSEGIAPVPPGVDTAYDLLSNKSATNRSSVI